jgi:hypothetical protein
VRVSRGSELADVQWEVIAPLMPQVVGSISVWYRLTCVDHHKEPTHLRRGSAELHR